MLSVKFLRKDVSMKKRLIALILAVFCSLSLLSACQKEEEKEPSTTTTSPLPESTKVTSGADEAFTYDIYKDYAEITSYIGAGAMVNVPRTIEGTVVASIGKNAFYGNTTVTAVILPETVVNIGLQAFAKCTSLKEIAMPNVKAIGNEAFRGSGLETVTIPPIVENLGKYSFAETQITTFTMPKDLIRAGDYTFSGCPNLTGVTFAESNNTITARMFNNCPALTEFVVPAQITTIDEYAFSGCANLTRVTIPDTVTEIKEGIFYNSPNVIIVTEKGSAAEKYAQNYSLTCEYVK